MRKIIGAIALLLLLPYLAAAGPRAADAAYLRFFAAEEAVLERFCTERELAEDQLMDVLILAGARMAPLLEREIGRRELPCRRYAIAALGHVGGGASIAALERILQDKSERDYIRVDALESIAQIDSSYARAVAPAYENDAPAVARCAREVLASRERLYRRSFASAFWHRHE